MPPSTDKPDDFMNWVRDRNPNEPEFVQSVGEAHAALAPHLDAHPEYREARILERLTEPDRVISFRVAWLDDRQRVQINRGWRVQHSNAIGPYKGGLRFHPTVGPSVLKFLAFEQTFKNALTGLPMGAGKGGSDFDPRGRSDHEIMRFCQAFMQELFRHIGPQTDVPAGDINVGEREIGYLYGQYKKLLNTFSGAMTGKGLAYGGAPMRPEATGFGLVYFTCRMLEQHGDALDGKRVVISGAGNVARHAARKALELGARPLTLSNSDGFLLFEDGISDDALDVLHETDRRLDELAGDLGATWHAGRKPWAVECDVALPCATQNELGDDDAKALVDHGVRAVAEGANMPCTPGAIERMKAAGVVFGPAKAANAGGVAMSGLEMSQNAGFEHSDREVMAERLRSLMGRIHDRCLEHGGDGERVDYARGATVWGFDRVARAMLAFGVC